jgi:predicted MFS family arabinose efflux permease
MLVALGVDRVPAAERGIAMGMVSGAWDLGVFAGSLSIAAIVERSSYGVGFATAAALMVIALTGLVVVERSRISPRPRDGRPNLARSVRTCGSVGF